MSLKSLHHTPISNDPGTKATVITTVKSDVSQSITELLRLLERQLDRYIDDSRNRKYDGVTFAEITAVRSSLKTNTLPKLRSLESILHPINQLPKEVFALIPRFFTQEREDKEPYSRFYANRPLITMTHVCQSWRNVLLSTPGLWTRIDFSKSPESQQAIGFVRRSGNYPLHVYQHLGFYEHVEPFLSTTLHNMSRLQGLKIVSYLHHLDRVLEYFSGPAPALEHLEITNEPNITERSIELPQVFGGRLPKLTYLSLRCLSTDLRGFNFPSLTRFYFSTSTEIYVWNLISFFERSPLLESITISFNFTPVPSTPPTNRARLAALKELVLDQTACTTGLLDLLTLPKCVEMRLKGRFTGEEIDQDGEHAAQFHPSSIDHLPVTRGIAKAVAMPNSCILSGPNGNLKFWCFDGTRGYFDAEFFTSFSPIYVLGIKELWVGRGDTSFRNGPWEQNSTRVRSAFEVLTKVEDLTIFRCETEPFYATLALGATADGGILLPELRRLTTYAGHGDVDFLALIRCAKARQEHSRPLERVTIVFNEEPGAHLVRGLELLRGFVGELIYPVGRPPHFDVHG